MWSAMKVPGRRQERVATIVAQLARRREHRNIAPAQLSIRAKRRPGAEGSRSAERNGRAEGKWRLLLPGASGPRLTELIPLGLAGLVFQDRLGGLSNRSIVVVGNYEIGPISAEPCRAKDRLLRPRRS